MENTNKLSLFLWLIGVTGGGLDSPAILLFTLISRLVTDVGEQHHSAAARLHLELPIGLQRPGLCHLLHGHP